ncbi:wax ester/triacylglycerol synthase family O-acyltransferase [Mycobacterium sp. SMC-8]|uniref:WS/DGAT/MGAT family O-acyltransferase n=1 Tax=Mycobacterium sp. SMC-8 TaxID=2857060 RepID=UPI0021B4747B|nr:wax ester/triacylglycerol synthase family O-acyltransferase [Mycobacterium sp. SMC-8]UXA15059.1 wax ester/triacylglycerol synthase family O-acyltransferase [Mycobacterium sp. SMC-8]
MIRLNGMDAVLVYGEARNLHTHTMKIAVVQSNSGKPLTFEAFRQSLEARLHQLDPLRWRLIETPWRLHHPMWTEGPVDLDYHLRRVTVPAPGGRRELNRVIGEVASTPLDRTRPLWEFYFAEGLADHRVALIGKVHHSLADGVASANLMARFMGLVHEPPKVGVAVSTTPGKGAMLRTAARGHVKQVSLIPRLVTDAASGLSRVRRRARDRGERPDMAKMFDPPPCFLNHVVSPRRTFASATLPLVDVKATAKHLDVTFNDLVLATVSGALRELLLRYDGRADRPLLANVPVSTDKSIDRISGNELSGLPVSLPVHVDEPTKRVRLTAAATKIAKDDNQVVGPDLYSRIMSYLPTALAPAAFRWQATRAAHNSVMNVPISNVPGPRERGEIGGLPVTEFYSTGVLSAGVAINITVWSYADQLNISVLADDETFHDVHEATDAIVHAFSELRCAAGLSARLSPLTTAMAAVSAYRQTGDAADDVRP